MYLLQIFPSSERLYQKEIESNKITRLDFRLINGNEATGKKLHFVMRRGIQEQLISYDYTGKENKAHTALRYSHMLN